MNKPEKKETLFKILSVIAALLIWQIVSMAVNEKILLVSPVDVLMRLTAIWREEDFFGTVWFTLYHIALGFLAGFVLGILLALVSGRFKWFEILMRPWMATVRSVPVASFVVICLVWLSSRSISVFISFLIVIPVTYQNVLTGLKSMDSELIDVAKLHKMNVFQKLKYVYLPLLSPYIFSAATVCTGMAWKAGVAAEVIGTPDHSIGRELYLSKNLLDTDDLFAWTVVIVILSVLSEKLFLAFLRKILKISK